MPVIWRWSFFIPPINWFANHRLVITSLLLRMWQIPVDDGRHFLKSIAFRYISIPVSLCISISPVLTLSGCAVKREQMERGLESLEYRRSLGLHLAVPYGSGYKDLIINERSEALEYVRLLRTVSPGGWEGTKDKYPKDAVFRLEFRNRPYPLPPLMVVYVHPFGKVLIDEGEGHEYVHQMKQEAYDTFLLFVHKLQPQGR